MEIASLVVNIAGNITGATNSFKSLEQTSRSTASKIESNFASLKNIGATLFGGSVVKSIVDVGIQFQSIKQSFLALTGSAQGVNDIMGFIGTTAEKTGVNILSASKDFRMLLGSAQGAGYAMSDIKGIFSATADASLVLGMGADDATGIMRAFGQIMSKGTVQAEELKGQIGDRLPGALSLASKAMKVSNAELLKMMETGTLMSKDFLPKFASEMEKTFGSMAPMFQGTALKAMQDFDNALLKLKETVATSGLLDLVTKLARALTDAMSGSNSQGISDMRQVFSALSTVVDVVISALKTLKGIMDSFRITIADLVMLFIDYKLAILAITTYKTAYSAITAIATAETIKEATAESASVVAKKASGIATAQLTNAINSLNYTLMLLSQNTRVATAGLIGYNAGAEKAKTATSATNLAVASTATASTVASRALGVLGTVASKILFPIGLAWSFYEVMKFIAEQSGLTAQALEDMVSRMGVLELNTSIGKTKDKIEELKKELTKLYGIDYNKLSPKDIENSNFIQSITKDIAKAEKLLETHYKRRDELAKGQSATIEYEKQQRDEQILSAQHQKFETLENLKMQSLDENNKKLKAIALGKRKALQNIYESSLENGKVSIDYDKFKQVNGKNIYTKEEADFVIKSYDEQSAKVREEILKSEIANVSKFSSEMLKIQERIQGATGTTKFAEKWATELNKFTKEDIANAYKNGEMDKLQAKFQELFDAEVVKEYGQQIKDLKLEDLARTASSAEIEVMKLNQEFENLGTKGNEALDAKNEKLKQIVENARNSQLDAFKGQYGTAEERMQERRNALEKEFKELKASDPARYAELMKQNEKAMLQDDTLNQKKLEGVNTWGEAYTYWLEKTQASEKTWGQEIVSVFDTVANSMTNAMVDFLDITSDGFADFGKMATGILQEVYREIVRISIVKPLVSSIMGGVGSFLPTAWNGGIANGNGFQRFAGGYIAGGGYSSYDSLSNDTIPAMISRGEAVIPASSVNANRGLIQALISGRGQKFSSGYVANSSSGGNIKVEIINESGEKMQITKSTQTTDMEGMVIQAWISGISKNRYGSRDILGGR